MHPILFWIGGIPIATYGVLVGAGYLNAILYLKAYRKEMGLSEDRFWGLIYVLFLGAILGGKILFLILHSRSLGGLGNALRAFRYGFVFYGGFAGGVGAGAWYIRRHRLDFWSIADFFGPAVALGHSIGRLGCFAAGCCYGRETSLPWGVRFSDPRCLVEPGLWGIPLHPTQIYESLGNLSIFLFLHFGCIRPRLAGRRGLLGPRRVFLGYVLSYAALRFFVEFFRGDFRGGFWWGFSISQIVSMLVAPIALFLMFRPSPSRGR